MAGQDAALAAAGCPKDFHDGISGARVERFGLAEALSYLRDIGRWDDAGRRAMRAFMREYGVELPADFGSVL